MNNIGNEEKMQVVGYSEDKDAFYYFDRDSDNMVTFSVKGDVKSAATSLFDKVSLLWILNFHKNMEKIH